MILANGAFVRCPIAQIPFETPTFEVKARGPTQLFNKPIFDTLVYSFPLSFLCLVSSSMHTLYSMLDDAPFSSIASRHSSRPSCG